MKKNIMLFLLFLSIIGNVSAQSPKWTTYDYNNSNYSLTAVGCLATDANDNIWVGTDQSVVKFDQVNKWTVFNSQNSGMVNDKVVDIAVTGSNSIWVCTYGSGFLKFDGSSNWNKFDMMTTGNGMMTNYTYCLDFDNAGNAYVGIYCGNSQNAGLMKWNGANTWTGFNAFFDGYNYKNVEALAKDKQGNIWCGTSIGVFKYNPASSTFTSYTKENTNGGLCGNYVRTIAVDPNGNVWFGCLDKDPASGGWIGGGLSKFNGTAWTNYKPSNSNLTTGYVSAIAFRNNEVWVGTGFCGQVSDNKGLFKFDGTNWTSYVNDTKTFPGTCVFDLAVDKNNNLWIAGANILTKVDFNPTAVEETEKLPLTFVLKQNYPNPFNPSTKIKFSVPVETRHASSLQYVTLKVHDLLGREVTTLINEEESPGNYEVQFDGTSLPSGVYFYTLNANEFFQSKKMLLIK